jgi:hypothetical protein
VVRAVARQRLVSPGLAVVIKVPSTTTHQQLRAAREASSPYERRVVELSTVSPRIQKLFPCGCRSMRWCSRTTLPSEKW